MNNSKPKGMEKKKKKSTARKKPSKKELIELAEEKAGVVKDMADACGVSRKTMHLWIKKDEKLQQAVDDGREILIDLAKSGLKQKLIDGSEKSIIYVLGTLGRKEGFGNVIQVQDRSKLSDQLDDLSDEEILAEIEDSRRRMKKAK